ncbi:MAG: aminotransferase class V-fold PLP-dependent enzyme [Myxococcales bacterium]|nr:aminotransferase class V-fold PLP-dependent enzyme [Myxococcales bacterium]
MRSVDSSGAQRIPIDLNQQATTPCFPEVSEAIAGWLTVGGHPGEPGPRGARIRTALERARDQVRWRVGRSDGEVVFTSGATEALDLAIRGSLVPEDHAIVVATEHRAAFSALEASGAEVSVAPVASEGRVDPECLRALVTPRTRLLVCMAVNNEIGVMPDLAAVAAVCAETGVRWCCDASQLAFARLTAGPDLVVVSGHKIGGPQGIGALVLRPGCEVRPQVVGGGQQGGLRGGTLPVALAVGLGEAAARVEDADRVRGLRDALWTRLSEAIGSARRIGSVEHRAPHNLSVCLPGIDARALVVSLADEVAIGTGSACSSGVDRPSHVLEAVGLTGRDLASVLRFGLGRETSSQDVERAAEGVVALAVGSARGGRACPP